MTTGGEEWKPLNDLNHLNELEYRLWLLQGEVNRAMQEFDAGDGTDSSRLDHMASEIAYLQGQVAAMKERGRERALASVPLQPQAYGQQSSPLQPQTYGQPSVSLQPQGIGQPLPPLQPQGIGQPSAPPQPQRGPLPYGQPQPGRGPLPYGQPQPGRGPLPYRQPLPGQGPLPQGNPQPAASSGGRDFEKTLGTGIMGIIASVLIFISMIIFGGLLLPYLTDAVMTGIMFLLSFSLFGAGYFLLRKDPKNKFHLSLCACGATALCVSLFVTRLYFALIGDGAFLVLIVFWLGLMAFICRKYQSILFRIIGEIGVFLTLCLGTGKLAGIDMAGSEWFLFCMLLVVYGGSTLLLDYIIPSQSYEKNAFFHCVRTLVLFLTLAVFVGETEGGIGVYAGFAAVTVYLLAELYRSCREALRDGCLFYCLVSVNCLTYCTILCGVFRLESFLPYFIAAVLLTVFFEWRQSKNVLVGNAIACLLFLWSGWTWLHGSVFYGLLVVLPLFAYGHLRKNRIPLYIGLFGILGIIGAESTVPHFVLLWAVPFVCFVVLARLRKDEVFTALGYPLYMLCGAGAFWGLLSEYNLVTEEAAIVLFLASAVLHILLIKLRAFDEDRVGFEIVAGCMTVFLMLWGSYAVYQEYLNVCSMAVTLALYTMNTVNLLKKSENFGYYIGLKYTLCMILLVDAHFELSMLISVLMLLFAAGSIAFGFYKSYKSFRIYGLILSMVSVFKLILFDVSSKSALYNAVGFLVCGLICFGISFLYNKIENRVKKK